MIASRRDGGREAAYQDLLGVARNNFLAYVIESSSPVVVDDGDRRMLSLFQEIYEKERHYVERGYDLLDKSGLRPLPAMHKLSASNFNFLRPMKIAEHWSEQVASEIARLDDIRSRVHPDDPCAAEFVRLADDFIALRRESQKRVADLRAAVAAPAKA